MNASSIMKIAVLGAGPMGLAVAYQLVREGYHPVIFEADDRIGGMTATFNFAGIEIERFYHFHCVSDQSFFKILDELSISNEICWVETKMGYWFQNRLQPWGNPFALLRFSGLGMVSKIRYGIHAFLCTKVKNWRYLDKLLATYWIQRWVGKEAYDVLWKKLFDLKFYEYSDSVSAAWIWSRIRRIGRSRYSLFKEKLGYLNGGSSTLLNAMREAIESGGGKFRLKTPISLIRLGDNGVIGIESGDGFESFEKIISTIPLPYIPRIIPNLPTSLLDSYKSIKNIAVVCVVIKLSRSVTENFWLNINDPEIDIPGIVEYTNLRSIGKYHIVYAPFYMPGDHLKFKDSDKVFIEKVKSYLMKINPNISNSDILDAHASRYQFAQPVCSPGHLESLPPAQLPIKGLWIADTSYYYPEDRGISESIEFGRKLALQAVKFL